jgi:hypothetical protein
MSLRKVWKLLRERRAVSVAISNVILAGAVIVVGFVVLFWAQSRSSSYGQQYSQATSNGIAAVKEGVTYEYVFYNRTQKNLLVYIMNYGLVGNATVQTVYLSNATLFTSFSSISLKSTTTRQQLKWGLSTGSEGYFTIPISPISLTKSATYNIRIVTNRGNGFETTFVA